MIKDGRLQAFTLSPATCQRPQWKITEAAVQAFENAKREPQPEKSRRRRKPDPDVIQFYQ